MNETFSTVSKTHITKKECIVDDQDKEIISKNPDLELAQLRFFVNHMELDPTTKSHHWNKLLTGIKKNDMGPYYELVCEEMGIPIDEMLMDDMKQKNKTVLEKFDTEIKDAEENLGESEVRQAWLRKSEYLCQIGNKEEAVTAFKNTYEKTVGIGYRIDLVFNLIRLGLFFMDHQLINSNLTKAKELMDQGGDWERKNRLRSYEGLYRMSVRDFKAAADLFLEAVPTFGSYELMSYERLVFYTVVSAMLALTRPDLRERVVRCHEIQEQLVGGGAELALANDCLNTFHDCHYDRFFQCLGRLESERLKFDRYLEPHYGFYTRAVRLKTYQQFLTPYKTVRLGMMADAFCLGTTVLDGELHRFVANGSLPCRIDAVRGIIEMNHPDSKNDLYRVVVRDGDILLNRIQKLARVINQ